MTTVKYPNGVYITYDETIKVGDLIATYNKGFYKMEKITPRGAGSPLAEYSLFAKEDGTLHKGKNISKCCDMSYCRHARESVADSITLKEKEVASLKAFQLIC